MAEPLFEELEQKLARVSPEGVIEAVIKWKDTGETENVLISLRQYRGDDEGNAPEGDVPDEDIFFYCDGVDGLRALLRPENGEDFEVISFE